ncbi:Meiotic expression up-regulated protein 10 [Smittium culicis]|uniref:Meiotic expression up-regulated protein 10 n=1 Tax=Smittium culicis TaxID=133412 RepID=A0A1R1WY81_9FUNG|nr:Meiotic expression up-regulated protein 10 [Smittium culicis]
MKISLITFIALPIALSATSIKEILSKGKKTLVENNHSQNNGSNRCLGDIDVKKDEINKLNSCTSYQGNIKIILTDIEEVSLKSLKNLEGSILVVGNSALKKLDFSGLKTVIGSIYIGANYQLNFVDFSNLESSYKVAFKHNFELNNVKLTNLSECKDLSITGSSIQDISVSRLTKIEGDLKFSKNTKLSRLNFNSLKSIGGDLEFGTNKKSSSLEAKLEKLETVKGGVTLRGLYEINLNSLKSIGSSLLVRDNDIKSLKLPKLESFIQ